MMISHARETMSSAPSPATKRTHPRAPKKRKLIPHISKRLHNFPLPDPKWGGTRTVVRSGRPFPGDNMDLALRSCSAFTARLPCDDLIPPVPLPALETFTPVAGMIGFANPEIKEFSNKLLAELRSAFKKEFRLLEDANSGDGNEGTASAEAPSNPRARRSRCRSPDELGVSFRLDAPASPLLPVRPLETENPVNSGRSPFADLLTSAMESWPGVGSRPGGDDDDAATSSRPWNLRPKRPVWKPWDELHQRDAPAMTSTPAGALAKSCFHADASTARPWNLRPKKAIWKPWDEVLRRDAPAMSSTPAAAVAEKVTTNLAKSSRLRSSVAGEGCSRRKFALELTKEEIADDWFAFTGSRPSRRPTKRPRNVQKQLNLCFPGSFLSEITPETYRVHSPRKR